MTFEIKQRTDYSPALMTRSAIEDKIAPVRNEQESRARSEAVGGSSETISEGMLAQSIEELRNSFQNVRRSLDFTIDEQTGQTVVKVIDQETDEVIRQIPAEEILAVMRRIKEFSGSQGQGLFVIEKV